MEEDETEEEEDLDNRQAPPQPGRQKRYFIQTLRV
jgi:hypothetical protein